MIPLSPHTYTANDYDNCEEKLKILTLQYSSDYVELQEKNEELKKLKEKNSELKTELLRISKNKKTTVSREKNRTNWRYMEGIKGIGHTLGDCESKLDVLTAQIYSNSFEKWIKDSRITKLKTRNGNLSRRIDKVKSRLQKKENPFSS